MSLQMYQSILDDRVKNVFKFKLCFIRFELLNIYRDVRRHAGPLSALYQANLNKELSDLEDVKRLERSMMGVLITLLHGLKTRCFSGCEADVKAKVETELDKLIDAEIARVFTCIRCIFESAVERDNACDD